MCRSFALSLGWPRLYPARSQTDHSIDLTLKLLDSPEDSDIFQSTVQMMVVLGGVPEVVSVMSKSDPPCFWRIIRTLCVKGNSPEISSLWKCVDGIVSSPEGLDAMMDAGALVRMLGILFNTPGHAGYQPHS